MTEYVLTVPTGFRNNNPSEPVVIYEKSRKKVFYDTTWLGKPIRYFNLPEGEYYTNNNLSVLKKVIPKKLHRLPRRERYRPNPSNFDIVFSNNPNKCSIDWDNGQIIFDHSLEKAPTPHIVFILYHEIGHQFFGREQNADAYARNAMLLRGYNESQIGDAIISTLNQRNDYRKSLMIDSLVK